MLIGQVYINININQTHKYYQYTQKLSYGNKGMKVFELQYLLRKNNYLITVDGHFGIMTEIAVKAFQASNNLKPDGIVGFETWKKLSE